MPIDHLDVRSYWDKQKSKYQPPVEYRTVEMSEAWARLREYLDEFIKDTEAMVEARMKTLCHAGDYGYESLVKQKTLVDISQAELLILEQIAKKVKSFHEEGA